MGVVSFSTRATTEIQFKAPQNLDKIKSSVLGIKYYAGGTRMDLGLKESHLRLFSAEYGMRANVPHVLLAITDGKSDLGKVLSWGNPVTDKHSIQRGTLMLLVTS